MEKKQNLERTHMKRCPDLQSKQKVSQGNRKSNPWVPDWPKPGGMSEGNRTIELTTQLSLPEQ